MNVLRLFQKPIPMSARATQPPTPTFDVMRY